MGGAAGRWSFGGCDRRGVLGGCVGATFIERLARCLPIHQPSLTRHAYRDAGASRFSLIFAALPRRFRR
jgi:hypothetical protein